MRIPYTQEMKEMQEKVEPYLVPDDGLKRKFKEGTPKEIIELKKKLDKIFDEKYEEAMKVM